MNLNLPTPSKLQGNHLNSKQVIQNPPVQKPKLNK